MERNCPFNTLQGIEGHPCCNPWRKTSFMVSAIPRMNIYRLWAPIIENARRIGWLVISFLILKAILKHDIEMCVLCFANPKPMGIRWKRYLPVMEYLILETVNVLWIIIRLGNWWRICSVSLSIVIVVTSCSVYWKRIWRLLVVKQ